MTFEFDVTSGVGVVLNYKNNFNFVNQLTYLSHTIFMTRSYN